MRIPFKDGPPRSLSSMGEATPDRLCFVDGELAWFLASVRGRNATAHGGWVSPLTLVPKPGVNKGRLIIDLRP